jgi:hypothetical protein
MPANKEDLMETIGSGALIPGYLRSLDSKTLPVSTVLRSSDSRQFISSAYPYLP